MNNGPSYEPRSLDLPDGLSYCVDCGNVMVFNRGRECPACHVDTRVDKLEDRVEQLEDD